ELERDGQQHEQTRELADLPEVRVAEELQIVVEADEPGGGRVGVTPREERQVDVVEERVDQHYPEQRERRHQQEVRHRRASEAEPSTGSASAPSGCLFSSPEVCHVRAVRLSVCTWLALPPLRSSGPRWLRSTRSTWRRPSPGNAGAKA